MIQEHYTAHQVNHAKVTYMTDVAKWCSANAAPPEGTPTVLLKCRPCSPACTKAGSIGMGGSMGTLKSAHMR